METLAALEDAIENFAGCAVVISVFFALAVVMIRIAQRTRDLYSRLVVLGVIGCRQLIRERDEAARRKCTGNLKQMGLAIANFESIRKVFPCGRVARAQSGAMP